MKPKNKTKREFLAQQTHEQLEIFVLNHEFTEKTLRDRLFLLAGCHNFGGQDGTDGSCVECFYKNKQLHERCCLFQTVSHAYHCSKIETNGELKTEDNHEH